MVQALQAEGRETGSNHQVFNIPASNAKQSVSVATKHLNEEASQQRSSSNHCRQPVLACQLYATQLTCSR
jgi:hypothetical protein